MRKSVVTLSYLRYTKKVTLQTSDSLTPGIEPAATNSDMIISAHISCTDTIDISMQLLMYMVHIIPIPPSATMQLLPDAPLDRGVLVVSTAFGRWQYCPETRSSSWEKELLEAVVPFHPPRIVILIEMAFLA